MLGSPCLLDLIVVFLGKTRKPNPTPQLFQLPFAAAAPSALPERPFLSALPDTQGILAALTWRRRRRRHKPLKACRQLGKWEWGRQNPKGGCQKAQKLLPDLGRLEKVRCEHEEQWGEHAPPSPCADAL